MKKWTWRTSLRATEVLHGGRDLLALKMHIKPTVITYWHIKKFIPEFYIKDLIKLSNNKFTKEDFKRGAYEES